MPSIALLDRGSCSLGRARGKIWLGALLLFASLLLSNFVSAAPSEMDLLRAEGMATEAKAYFKGKLFRQAADKFMEAYVIAKRPALIFNSARAYEEAKMDKRAIAIFLMYTKLHDVSRDGKIDANRRIKRLQARVALREKAERDRLKLEEQRRQKRDYIPPPHPKKQPPLQQAPSPRRGPFPLWRTASGGALIALGLINYGVSHAIATELPSKEVTNRELMTKYLDNAASARAWYGAFIGATAIGVGLIAWGQYDYWLPPPVESHDATLTWQIVPAVTSRGAAFDLRVRF